MDAPATSPSTAPSHDALSGFVQGPVLVAFATQSGAAEGLAEATLDQLESAGIEASIMDFYDLNLDVLAQARQVLFVSSTTFDGEPPDMAEPFCEEAMATPAALEHLHYALLGLGDRVYDEFCGFGHRLNDWLLASKAQPWFNMVEVDDEDDDAINRWHEAVAAMIDATVESKTAQTA